MTSNHRSRPDDDAGFCPEDDGDDLAELVNGAVKALSVGNPPDTDGEARRAVDSLKHQLESTRAVDQPAGDAGAGSVAAFRIFSDNGPEPPPRCPETAFRGSDSAREAPIWCETDRHVIGED